MLNSMDFGFNIIMGFAMNIDKLGLANLLKYQIICQKTYFKVKILNSKTSLALLDLTRPSCPLMSKCQNFNVNLQTSCLFIAVHKASSTIVKPGQHVWTEDRGV